MKQKEQWAEDYLNSIKGMEPSAWYGHRREAWLAGLEFALMKIKDIIKTQIDSTNNSDSYFTGMTNGMLVIESCLSGEERKFFNCPKSDAGPEPVTKDE